MYPSVLPLSIVARSRPRAGTRILTNAEAVRPCSVWVQITQLSRCLSGGGLFSPRGQHPCASGHCAAMRSLRPDLFRAIAVSYEIRVNLVKGICLHEHKIDYITHIKPSAAVGIGTLLDLDKNVMTFQSIQQAQQPGHQVTPRERAKPNADRVTSSSLATRMAFWIECYTAVTSMIPCVTKSTPVSIRTYSISRLAARLLNSVFEKSKNSASN
jgi:2-methylcitrate dehydratase MmgE/PrpD-like protein